MSISTKETADERATRRAAGMSRFAKFGNDLYTGAKSFDFVGRYKTWYAVSGVLLVLALLGLGVRQLNLGIEFTGGSDFRVSNVADLSDYEGRAKRVIGDLGGVEGAMVTQVGSNGVRVQTERFDDAKSIAVASGLASEFKVGSDAVSSSVIGPSWGASVSKKALQALAWFLVLVSIVLAVYFRTWKMALAALVALLHDIFITVGVYALLGLEVTPASMIGFLTILGYSLYDTVVVFDKVRENTDQAVASGRTTFSAAANLAVNQTLVRSINTTVVALLPVSALLLVGVVVLGPGTLLDLSVALFIGIAVGAYSSIFIATPLYAHLREGEADMKQLAKRVARRGPREVRDAADVVGGASGGSPAAGPVGPLAAAGLGPASAAPLALRSPYDSDDSHTVTGRPVHPYVQRGPRNQPKRPPKSKR